MKLLKNARKFRVLKLSAYVSTVIIALITFSNFFASIPSLFSITLSAYDYILITCILETLILSVTSALLALQQKKFFYGLLFLLISIAHQISFALLKMIHEASLISFTSPVYSFQPWLFAILIIIYLESISRFNRAADEKRLLRGTRIGKWLDPQIRESTGNSARESVVIKKLDINLAKVKGWNFHLKYLVVLGLVFIIFYTYQISDKSVIIIQWISAIPLVNSLDYLSLELRFLSLIGLGILLAVLVIGKVISETYNAAFTTSIEARHIISGMIRDIEQNPLKSIEDEFSRATNELQNKLSSTTGRKLINIILPGHEYFAIMSFLVIGLSLLLLQNLPQIGLGIQISAALSQIITESQFAVNTFNNLFSILTVNINIAMTEIVKIVDSFFT